MRGMYAVYARRRYKLCTFFTQLNTNVYVPPQQMNAAVQSPK